MHLTAVGKAWHWSNHEGGCWCRRGGGRANSVTDGRFDRYAGGRYTDGSGAIKGESIMPTDTLTQIEERLRHLPEDKLSVVLDFVSYLSDRPRHSPALQTMLATEAVLREDWDSPEEDAAWEEWEGVEH